MLKTLFTQVVQMRCFRAFPASLTFPEVCEMVRFRTFYSAHFAQHQKRQLQEKNALLPSIVTQTLAIL